MSFEPKIIVIGERCLDIEQRLKITRINPEFPSSVIGVPTTLSVKGGMAENVVNNLKSLGLKDSEICFITNGTAIVKRRFVEEINDAIILRIDENDDVITKQGEYFCGDTYKDLMRVVEGHKTIKILVFSDYGKGYIDEYWIEQVTNLCNKHGIITLMDTRKQLGGSWAENIDWVKINSKEYTALNDAPNCRNLLVTRGEKGIEWVNKGMIFPTKPVFNPSTTGAGDSTLAGLAFAFLQGKEPIEAIKFANVVGRIAVSKPGTATVSINEVAKEMQ